MISGAVVSERIRCGCMTNCPRSTKCEERWSVRRTISETIPQQKTQVDQEWCKARRRPQARGASEGRRIRRAIARINFMAQDRPDLSSAALVVSQHMSSPTTGTSEAVKIIFRYIKKYTTCVQNIESYNGEIICWVNSDWAGAVSSRQSCSGSVGNGPWRGCRILE